MNESPQPAGSETQPGTLAGNGAGRHSQGDASAVQHYLGVLRRRVWIIITAVVVCVTIGVVQAFRSPRVYQGVAKVIVERQVPRLAKVDGVVNEGAGWDPDFYTTQAELARSKVVLDLAVGAPAIAEMFRSRASEGQSSRSGGLRNSLLSLLGAVPAPPPEPWEVLQSYVRTDYLRDTHFILVKAESLNARQAATIANAVAVAFTEYHVKQRAGVLGEAFRYLQSEKEKEEQLLGKSEKALQEFRETAKAVALTASTKDQPVLERMTELDEKITQVQLRKIEATAQLSVMRDIVGATGKTNRDQMLLAVPAVKKDQEVKEALDKLNEAEKQADKMSLTYGPEHPVMLEAAAAVARIRKQFEAAMGRVVLAQDNEIKTLIEEEQGLSKQYDEQKAKAMELAREVFTFTNLQGEVARHRKLLETLVDRMREVDLSSGFLRTNAQVVEDAKIPSAPFKPNRNRMVLTAIIIGLILGTGLAFFVEHLDDTIKTPEDLKERIGLPILGFVPRMAIPVQEENKPPEPGEERHALFQTVGLVCVREPTSSVAEAYRNVRTRLFFSIPDDGHNILGFTSCVPGEGKTTTATNLALATALAGKTVLLIDADMHRPMVHQVFGLAADVGLTTLITNPIEPADVIRTFQFEDAVSRRLDVITAGPESPNPAELLGSQKMKDLLAWARKNYDWVFVDMPPVLYISDASVVSAMCRNVVFVVRAAKNNRSMILRARAQLEELKVRIIGCVLNDVMLSRLGRYYSDYSYYGYSKYKSSYHKSYQEEKRDGSPTRNSSRGGKT